MVKRKALMLLVVLMAVVLMAGQALAAEFKIAIMQDSAGDAKKYRPLAEYLQDHGVNVQFVTARDYSAAARMFADGKVDAMFSGSGVAGAMLIKGLATPVVRPVDTDGVSTYWAVVLAPKGSKKFTGSGDYFKGKKSLMCSLASSGEIYYRAIKADKAGGEMQLSPSHGAAIDALAKGQADIAIVKNLVWDSERSRYPSLIQVGEDRGENPNGTLIVAKGVDKATVGKVKGALMGIEKDSSPKAKVVKDELKIRGFIETSEADFDHTISLLKAAGADANFDFKF